MELRTLGSTPDITYPASSATFSSQNKRGKSFEIIAARRQFRSIEEQQDAINNFIAHFSGDEDDEFISSSSDSDEG